MGDFCHDLDDPDVDFSPDGLEVFHNGDESRLQPTKTGPSTDLGTSAHPMKFKVVNKNRQLHCHDNHDFYIIMTFTFL